MPVDRAHTGPDSITIRQRHAIGQAFLHNAFFFTFGDALSPYFGGESVGWRIAAFAASNVLGALLLSPLFDSVGRVRMIAGPTSCPASCWPWPASTCTTSRPSR